MSQAIVTKQVAELRRRACEPLWSQLLDVFALFSACITHDSNGNMLDEGSNDGDWACELPLVLDAAETNVAKAEFAAAREHCLYPSALLSDYLDFLPIGLNLSRALQKAVSRSEDVGKYMAMVGAGRMHGRPIVQRIVKSLGEELPPPGFLELFRPLVFFLELSEIGHATCIHCDSSFGITWMPKWRQENLSLEMLDTAAYDAAFQRTLANVATGMAEVVTWGEWWPVGGTLLALLRYGALVGKLSAGKVDAAVGKDIEFMVGVATEKEWEDTALKLTAFLWQRFRIRCSPKSMQNKCLPIRRSCQPGVPIRNNSLYCVDAVGLRRCTQHEHLCRYAPDMQIISYFRDTVEQAAYIGRVSVDAAGALGCKPGVQCGAPLEQGSSGNFFNIRGEFSPWRGKLPLGLLYPLRSCLAGSFSVPCPAHAPRIIEKMYGPCAALPRITRDRRVDDWRNHELASKGLDLHDVEVLREHALRLQHLGFLSFGESLASSSCKEMLQVIDSSDRSTLSVHVPEQQTSPGSKEDASSIAHGQTPVEDALDYYKAQFKNAIKTLCDSRGAKEVVSNAVFKFPLTMASSWLLSPVRLQDMSYDLPVLWQYLGPVDIADYGTHLTRGLFPLFLVAHQREMTLAAVLVCAVELVMHAVSPPEGFNLLSALLVAEKEHAQELASTRKSSTYRLRLTLKLLDGMTKYAEEQLGDLDTTFHRFWLAWNLLQFRIRNGDEFESSSWCLPCLEEMLFLLSRLAAKQMGSG